MNGTAGTVEPLERRIGAWVHALMLSVRQRPDGVILLPLFARINQLLSACERERERDKDADTLARDRHRAFAFLAVVERSPLLDEEERAIVREAMSDWCQAFQASWADIVLDDRNALAERLERKAPIPDTPKLTPREIAEGEGMQQDTRQYANTSRPGI